MIEHVLHNKKGISMMELLAYTALSGTVMALLASVVLFVTNNTTRIYEKSKLNTQSTQLYSQTLNWINGLSPDTVNYVYITESHTETLDATTTNLVKDSKGNPIVIGVEFYKRVEYVNIDPNDPASERKAVSTDTLVNKQNRIRFIYNSTDSSNTEITIKTQTPTQKSNGNQWEVTNLELKGVDISEASFELIVANEANTYVKFGGLMSYGKKSQSYSYMIPVFTTILEEV